jgi:hypothetical protein
MPRARHAARHSGRPDQQRRARRDRVPPRPRPRGRTVRYGSVALTAAFALLVGTAVMRAAANHGNTATLLALSCPSAPRLAADTSVAPGSTTPLGVNASGPGQLAAATSEFGHMPVIRVYYATAIPGPQEWSTGVLGIGRSSVVLSFYPPPAEILSGADDGALRRFFDAAPTGHAIYYSYYAEPESYIRKGQFSMAQFKAAFTHIVAIADAAHNPYLHSTLILQGQDARPGDEYNFRNYLPSGGVISALGWDAYPDGTVEDQTPYQTAPSQFMGPDVAAARSVGLPFGFAEFALGTSNGQPQWLTEVANYLQSNGALFGTLFNASGFPWMMLHDSASIQAWRSAVARSASDTPVAGPVSTPTPAPKPAKSTPAAVPAKSTPAAVPAKSTPAPVPSGSAPAGPTVTGLTITPRTLAVTGGNFVGIRSMSVRIRFKLSQPADVSICVLNSLGRVVREINKPGSPAGWVTRWYFGYGQHRRLLPAGRYQVMVVASNAKGIATAQLGLTVTGHAGCECVLNRTVRR